MMYGSNWGGVFPVILAWQISSRRVSALWWKIWGTNTESVQRNHTTSLDILRL